MSAKKSKEKTPGGDLVAAARDINAVLKPDPAIDLESATLTDEIVELLPSIKEGDALTPETWATLKVLGWGKKESEKKPGILPDKKKDKSPKEKKPAKIGRREAVIRAFCKHKAKKRHFTTESIIAEAHKIAVSCGNTDKPHQTKSQALAILDALQLIGVVTADPKNPKTLWFA